MNVKILKIDQGVLVDAKIVHSKFIKIELPSIHDGWRFNFTKHSKQKNLETYILVTTETPHTIEGCLTFEMKKGIEPYMAYIELAPYQTTTGRKYDYVAGCLIAFACRLSFIQGKEDYKGYLAFDVLEEKKDSEIKLMNLYSTKYKALRIGYSTTMIIPPEGGQKLIEEFLTRDYES